MGGWVRVGCLHLRAFRTQVFLHVEPLSVDFLALCRFSRIESPNPRRRAAPPRRGIRSRDLRRWPGQARASLKLRTSLRLRWLQSSPRSSFSLQNGAWNMGRPFKAGKGARGIRGRGQLSVGTLLGRPFYDDPKFVKLQPEQMRSPSRCVEPKQSKDVS